MGLPDYANIATIFGFILTILAISITAYQIYKNTRVNQAHFWLELEKMFATHDEVHLNLRPGGDWVETNSGPNNLEEWGKVEDYMRLFEHCKIMLKKKLIDRQTFESIYKYRLKNIVANECIVNAKLIDEKSSWADFIDLLEMFEIQYKTAPK